MTSSDACADVLQSVSEYVDQELDAATCRRLEAHCAECESCARILEGLRDTIGLCRATAQRPLPPAVREHARASIARLLGKAR